MAFLRTAWNKSKKRGESSSKLISGIERESVKRRTSVVLDATQLDAAAKARLLFDNFDPELSGKADVEAIIDLLHALGIFEDPYRAEAAEHFAGTLRRVQENDLVTRQHFVNLASEPEFLRLFADKPQDTAEATKKEEAVISKFREITGKTNLLLEFEIENFVQSLAATQEPSIIEQGSANLVGMIGDQKGINEDMIRSAYRQGKLDVFLIATESIEDIIDKVDIEMPGCRSRSSSIVRDVSSPPPYKNVWKRVQSIRSSTQRNPRSTRKRKHKRKNSTFVIEEDSEAVVTKIYERYMLDADESQDRKAVYLDKLLSLASAGTGKLDLLRFSDFMKDSTVVNNLPTHQSQRLIANIFHGLDPDENGTIDNEEFFNAFCGVVNDDGIGIKLFEIADNFFTASYVAMQREIDDLNDDFELERERLKEEITEERKLTGGQKSRLHEFEDVNLELDKELKDREATIVSLRKQLIAANKKIEDLSTDNLEDEDEDQSKSKLSQYCIQLEQELEEEKTYSNSLNVDLTSKKEECEELSNRLKSLQDQFNQSAANLEKASSENTFLNDKLLSLNRQVESYQDTVRDLNDQIVQQQEESARMKSQLQQQIDILTADLKAVQIQLAAVKGQDHTQELQDLLESYKNKVIILNSQIAEIRQSREAALECIATERANALGLEQQLRSALEQLDSEQEKGHPKLTQSRVHSVELVEDNFESRICTETRVLKAQMDAIAIFLLQERHLSLPQEEEMQVRPISDVVPPTDDSFKRAPTISHSMTSDLVEAESWLGYVDDQDEVNDLRSVNSSQGRELQKMHDQIAILSATIAARDLTIKELEASEAQNKLTLLELSEKLKRLQDESQGQIQTTIQNKNSSTQVNQQRSKESQNQAELDAARKLEAMLRERLEASATLAEDRSKKIKLLKDDIDLMKSHIDSLQVRIAELEKYKVELDALKLKLSQEKSSPSKHPSNLRDQILSGTLDKWAQEMLLMQLDEIVSAKREIEVLNLELANVRTALDDALKRPNQQPEADPLTSQRLAEALANRQADAEKLSEAHATISSLRTKLTETRKQLETSESNLIGVTQERDDLKKKAKGLKEQLKFVNEENDKLDKLNQTNSKKLMKLQKAVEVLSTAVQVLKANGATVTAELEENKKRRSHLEQETQHLRHELDQADSTIAQLNADLKLALNVSTDEHWGLSQFSWVGQEIKQAFADRDSWLRHHSGVDSDAISALLENGDTTVSVSLSLVEDSLIIVTSDGSRYEYPLANLSRYVTRGKHVVIETIEGERLHLQMRSRIQ